MTGFMSMHEMMGPSLSRDMPPDPGDDLLVDLPDENGEYLGEYAFDTAPPPFDANLAEFVDDDELSKISSELIQAYEDDLSSRSEWDKTLKTGLEILGLKLEDISEPFEGACSAHHPVLLEAVLQFQARAITELFPTDGPVKTRIVGAYSPETVSQSARVREFLNYQLTEVMEGYFEDLDQMLFMLPVSGSMFRKTYYDPTYERPCSHYISIDDFVVAYTTTDLRTCPRMTQIIRMSPNELRKNTVLGYYRDVDLAEPADTDGGEIKTAIDRIEGRSKSGRRDANHTLLEVQVDWDLAGFEDKDGVALPYIITIDKDSSTVLCIRRNWVEGDELYRKLEWITHYKFLPGPGFYGLSLIHVLGNLQKTATSLLRSLVDAGSFANLPAFLKARGLRMAGGDAPLKFGEMRDVEGYGDDLRKAIIPVPSKEPSQTLALLLGSVVEDARRLGAVADIAVGDANGEAPVGTTLALMEQSVKMMSAIHKRLHQAQRNEFRILARIDKDTLPNQYPYEVEGGSRTIFKQDFDGRIDVLPVSDPNVFSETQRIMRAQTQLQLAQQFPQQHNLHEALHRMHEVIGTAKIEAVLNPDRGPKLMDPATENFAVTQARAVKAFAYQDHNAHMQVHGAALQAFMAQAPQNPAMAQSAQVMMAHIAEHQAHLARMMIEQASGAQLPPPPDYDATNPNKDDGYSIDPQMEHDIAARQGQAAQAISQMQQQNAKMQQNAQAAQDPQVQLAQAQLQIEAQKVQQKAAEAQQKASDAQHKTALLGQQINNDMMDQERDRKLKAHEIAIKAELERERLHQEMIRAAVDRAAADDRAQLAARNKP